MDGERGAETCQLGGGEGGCLTSAEGVGGLWSEREEGWGWDGAESVFRIE